MLPSVMKLSTGRISDIYYRVNLRKMGFGPIFAIDDIAAVVHKGIGSRHGCRPVTVIN